MPEAQIAGENFKWFGGIYGGYNRLFGGSNLFTSYQRIYDPGFCWAGKDLRRNGSVIPNGSIFSDGILFADGMLLADGLRPADGLIFSDGLIRSDGLICSDGLGQPERPTLANSFISSNSSLFSNRTAVFGDN